MTTVTAGDISARGEFRENWFLLVATVLGAMFMSSHAFTNGIFAESWQREFGWTSGQISAGVAFTNAGLIIFPPLIGRLVDRYGVRRPTLLFLGLLPFAFATFTQIGPQLWTLYAAYFLFGAIGAGSGFVPFTRAISEYFDKGRGLALGIACSATSLSALAAPLLANQLLKAFGWREAWLGMGLVVVLIWPIVFFGLKEVRTAPRTPAATSTTQEAGFSRLVRDRNFWIIAIAFMFVTFAALGLVVQTVPYLMSVGFSRDQAVAAGTGLAVGLGLARVASGFLLDRIFAPRVFMGICLMGIAGCAALLCANAPLVVVVGVVIVGMVMGAEGDIMAYLASRYFGLLDYAKAYGLLFGLMGVGSVTAPAINGYIFEATGSYVYNIYLAALALLVSGLLVNCLPAYPARAPSR